MKNLFCFFLLWLIPITLSAQRYISGRITDAEDGTPIPGAAVFISNTSVGATSDTDGYFRLKIPGEGSYRLTVSFVGYQPVFKDIEPGKTSEVFHVAMKMTTMNEVTISAKVRFRKYDIDLFWRTLLGEKPSKRIQPLNPETVHFYFNSSTGILTVTCREPLQIVNYETGYHIHYILKYFTHDYRKDITDWDGECVFTELEPKTFKQKNTWNKNRKYVYSISVANFIKSLNNDSLLDDGFLFVWEQKKDFRVSNTFTDYKLGINSQTTVFSNVQGTTFDVIWAGMFLSIDSHTGGKMFYIPPEMNVMLISYGKPVPKRGWADAEWQKTGLFRNVVTTPDTVPIFSDGSYKNRIGFSPVFASNPITGLNLALPNEYLPDDHSIAAKPMAKDVEDEQPMKILSDNPLADTLTRVAGRFERQLSEFPQEKIYMQTDKPYYLAGERIWFRAHIVDAATHVPSFSSNIMFVELFDARDSVVSRIKIGIGNDLYSGYINIPNDTPEGDYTLRAYTPAMRNLDEDYFFMKNIRIVDPMSRMMQAVPEFEFLPDKKIGAEIRFSPTSVTERSQSVVTERSRSVAPTSLKLTINNQKPVNLKIIDDKSGLSFNLPSTEKQRVMLLDATYEKKPYRQYVKIPLPDDDFDVTFYPEGGSALYGVVGRIAFKAMQRDGTEIDVEGMVYDSKGNEMNHFKTDLRGMGQLRLMPEAGETYYAVCTNSKGQSKRFELPVAKETGYALSAAWGKDRLMLRSLSPSPSPRVLSKVQAKERGAETQKNGDTLCLIVHTRGVVQDVRIWENTDEPMIFQKDFFPSGISHLLLLTKDMIPVSERLIFVNHDDQAKVESATGRDVYSTRSPVDYAVKITDESGEPLMGNFSVSVTDDHEVAADTTMNILTELLLSSDLRGNIPDPAYFFRQKGNPSVYSLDLLMLTQGWRRYDTERIIKNDFMYPDTLLAMGYAISGTVTGRYLLQRPVEAAFVNIMSIHGNFSEATYTDRNGRFYLRDGDLPDSTVFLVQTKPQQNKQNLELTLDKVSYPERKIPVVASGVPDREIFSNYADKAERKYVDEHGMRIYHLSEVTISAPIKKGKDYSFFYKASDAKFVINEEDLKRNPPVTMRSLLTRLPGVFIESYTDSRTGGIAYRVSYGNKPVLIVVDDIMDENFIVEQIEPTDVLQIDLLSGSAASIFTRHSAYTEGLSHVISITTKKGKKTPKETPYIKHFMPLGFQKPAEFYAPKYDTPVRNPKPDLRTTIYWQPSITTDEKGTATFSFYTADTPSTYTVVIEGMTENGKIVYQRNKITVIQ